MEWRAVAQRAWLALQDRQVVPPIEDGASWPVVARDVPLMLGDDFALGDEDEPVGVDPQADGPIGERRRHAVTVALMRDQASGRHAFRMLHEAVEGLPIRHAVRPLGLPGLPDDDVSLGVLRVAPQPLALGPEPCVQLVQGAEGLDFLPDAVAAVSDVLLDLALC